MASIQTLRLPYWTLFSPLGWPLLLRRQLGQAGILHADLILIHMRKVALSHKTTMSFHTFSIKCAHRIETARIILISSSLRSLPICSIFSCSLASSGSASSMKRPLCASNSSVNTQVSSMVKHTHWAKQMMTRATATKYENCSLQQPLAFMTSRSNCTDFQPLTVWKPLKTVKNHGFTGAIWHGISRLEMELMRVRWQSTKIVQLKQWGTRQIKCPVAFLGKGRTRRSFFLKVSLGHD